MTIAKVPDGSALYQRPHKSSTCFFRSAMHKISVWRFL